MDDGHGGEDHDQAKIVKGCHTVTVRRIECHEAVTMVIMVPNKNQQYLLEYIVLNRFRAIFLFFKLIILINFDLSNKILLSEFFDLNKFFLRGKPF